MMLDVRFHVLNDYVEKFIVTESLYSHSGQPKKLNFDINNYPKFKDKIIYLVIDQEPNDLIKIENTKEHQGLKRINSLKRIELSYNYMMKATENLANDDLIILSDNDEIPNLNSKQFKQSNKNVFIFKQLFFYYKFNLLYDLMPWFGSKACKKKSLKSFSWLRNLKSKKYSFWRLDTYFNENKLTNLEIIKDGGWHFTNIKTPEELYIKMTNFGHHNEFELSGLTVEDLRKKIDEGVVFYNHFSDQTDQNKWNYDYKLKKINIDLLPKYLQDNSEKFKEWFK
jgi:beta-1,4-mannosyl-glycoprotein beta-1,4-N-acetylglucosaminyltransferase|tara:strand:- start:50 stop:895 length:846 start_codon:yes stop_codon:yes gene_type:complete